jgi:hypothetical protein
VVRCGWIKRRSIWSSTRPRGLRVALTVLLFAGASETLGQAVVLVLNRVSKRRFALALVLGGLELLPVGLERGPSRGCRADPALAGYEPQHARRIHGPWRAHD